MRTGDQLPRLAFVPTGRVGAAEDVIGFALLCGLELDPWQRWVLENSLRETPDGKWSAFECVLIVPRRNGKSALLQAIMLAAVFAWGERSVIYSAHRFDTAQETFAELRATIEGSELADEVAKVYTANGKEAIILKNGCRIKFMARSRGSGRGFSADRIIFDEAMDLSAASMGAVVPSLASRSMLADSNPQIWYASSAPHSSSQVLHSLRRRAGTAEPGRLFFAEWSAEETVDNDDVDAWYQANPALGIRISEEFVRDELVALQHSPGEFARERLGIPDPEPTLEVEAPPKLPATEWAGTAQPAALAPAFVEGDVRISFAVAPGGAWSSVAVAVGTLAAPWVEMQEHRQGVGWLPDYLAEKALKWNAPVVCCQGSGASAAEMPAVRAALIDAEFPAERIRTMSSVEYKAACQAFYTDVVEGRLQRPEAPHGARDVLDVTAADAAEKVVGDGWVWDWRRTTVPVSPIEAVTVARACLAVPAVRERKLARVMSF